MWRGIEGHDAVAEQFGRLLARGRLASTFLFVGPPGVGKRLFAHELARCLLCAQSPDTLDACGRCTSCQLSAAGSHPDLLTIAPLPDKTAVSIDQLIGAKERRHQEGLCHDISLRPLVASRRVAVIDEADTFNTECANCLLKTLEEPPPRSVLILIGTSESRQLPTIRSRSQIVRFSPLSTRVVEDLLRQQWPDAAAEAIAVAAAESGGSLARGAALLQPGLTELRTSVLAQLRRPAANVAALVAAVQEATDSSGKEAAERRHYLISLLQSIVDQLRHELRGAVHNGASQLAIESLTSTIDHSLHAIEHVARNAHLANVILAWLQHCARLAPQWPAIRG